MSPASQAPSFSAEKGTFKDRVRGLPKELDFFGERFMDAFHEIANSLGAIEEQAVPLFIATVNATREAIHDDTPKKTGHAQSGWIFERKDENGVISFWYWNGVEYIVYLEFGWSQQRPEGFVRINLDRMASKMGDLAREMFG